MIVSVMLKSESGKPEWREVDLPVRDGIAIQPRFEDDTDTRPYRVIHVKTGLSLMAAQAWMEAWQMQEWFAEQVIAGVPLADLPACELCNIAPAMSERVLEQFEKCDTRDVVTIARLLECEKPAEAGKAGAT